MKPIRSRDEAPKRKRTNVPAREFIKAWIEASSLDALAQLLGSSKQALRSRAYRFRRLGVPLPEFPEVEYVPNNYESLAEYAQGLLDSKK